MLRVPLFALASIAALMVSAVAVSKELTCPEAPKQFTRDVVVDTQAKIHTLGKVAAGEIQNKMSVVAQPLLDKVPNADRLALAQMMMSVFCQTISQDTLPEREKLDRIEKFNDQIMRLWQIGPSPRTNPRSAGSVGAAVKPTSFIDKYIDRDTRREKNKVNVALSMDDLQGSDVAPLEGAAQRALRGRGYNIVPLFRRDFVKDGLHREMFDGSAAIATKLELHSRCDSVLLGEVRFVGVPRNVGGMFISEAVLNIRAISPITGSVVKELEVREKGGGSSAADSTADALSRLEVSVEQKLAGWSLS